MDEAERCGRVGYIYMSKLIALGTVAELQQLPDANPAGTSRIQIDTPDIHPTILDRVAQHPGVREATIFGRSIHALVEHADRLSDLARRISRRRRSKPSSLRLKTSSSP